MVNKQIISIEGNIGVGKSTFVDLIKKNVLNGEIVSEPVEMWKNLIDDKGNNILQKFYEDIPRWAYSFQNLACITRMMKIENTIKNTNAEFIFLDRSLGTDKHVFEKMLYDTDKISQIEHKMYNLWCDFYYTYVRPEFENITIYLQCSPQTALSRIDKRGRFEEKSITIEYLTDLHNYHENWLIKNHHPNVIVVNCDLDFENDINYQNEMINNVVNQINIINRKRDNNSNPLTIKSCF